MSEPPFHQLDQERVMDAVESLGYLSDYRVFPLNSYENRVYQVGIEGAEPLIAKFYRPQRWSDAQIQEEHDFTLALQSLDLPVAAPIQRGTQSLFEHQGYRFALYLRRGGYPPELGDLDVLELLGEMVGRIHLLGEAQPYDHRPALTVDAFFHDSVAFLLAEGFIPTELTPAYQTLTRDLASALVPYLPTLQQARIIRLHGDCHVGNILWRDDRTCFVDFDDSRNGPAIQDLWLFLSAQRAEQMLEMDALLAGYERFRDFDYSELKLIEPLRTLRMVNYAAWLARRWQDPAFPHHFPWFNTQKYWAEHILALREQLALLMEPPLTLIR